MSDHTHMKNAPSFITDWHVVFASFLSFFISPFIVRAQANSTYTLLEPSIVGGQTSVDAGTYLSTLYTYAIGVAGVLAVIMFAIGGIHYMFPGKESKGKEFMTNAVFGIILALAAYLILNTINPDILKSNISLPTATVTAVAAPPPGAGGEPDGGGTSVPSTVPTTLPAGCKNYISAFKSAASSSGVDGCLLYGIASQESGCNPNLSSSAGACGMMQFLPSTAGQSCDWLKSHPTESIALAANYLARSKSALSKYSQFQIGSRYTQSNTTVTVGSYSYDAGNDDIIASYNAGYGTKTSSGKKGPFATSSSCASRDGTIPVWQCDIGGEGYAQTRNYVRRVQAFQDQCNAANVLK
jgi:hypothetical protein